MNNLDIISVNIWQIVISLCNLTILFLILKKLLFKPVKKMVSDREALAQKQLDDAAEERRAAISERMKWEEKLAGAQNEADVIIKKAVAKADRRSEVIVNTAKERADGIVSQAKLEAELEHKKAEREMRQEIIDLSSLLAGRMLKREINEEDHKELIDDFIEQIGQN
ncbi:MAG: F0F1 ATP synthase subunit B [Clostridiales bacterium]|nr:F0F1 ATP synthase subunit B [Clostridiales bacterium]